MTYREVDTYFRRFEKADQQGFAGANNLPDGTPPYIYDRAGKEEESFHIIIAGSEVVRTNFDVSVIRYSPSGEYEEVRFTYEKFEEATDLAVSLVWSPDRLLRGLTAAIGSATS